MKKLASVMILGFLFAPLMVSGCCKDSGGDHMTGKMKKEYGGK